MNALAHRRNRRMERKAPTGAAIQQVQRPWGVQGRRDAYRLTDEPFHIVAPGIEIVVSQRQDYRQLRSPHLCGGAPNFENNFVSFC